jgi:endonuclease/exonuclease/phosphatase family metal-dependent hydrolase
MTILTLMTVNAHKGFGLLNRRLILTELRGAIREVGADVVCLQEVLGEHSRHRTRHPHWDATPQYEFIADSIWPNYSYGRNAVYPEGHHGNALLSKFPIVSYRNLDASVAGAEQRGMLHAVLDLGGNGVLHVICVHLGLSERHRQQQTQMLCDVTRTEVPTDLPLVVAGDFNDWRGRAHRQLEDCGLEEVFVKATGTAARTFPARWPVLRLDRIYVRQAQHKPVLLPLKPWAHLSDHAPLAAEIHV